MLPQTNKNLDGSLTLHIQKDSPGTDKASNWLPAPDGPIYRVMRLYWPKSEAPSILPRVRGHGSRPEFRRRMTCMVTTRTPHTPIAAC
jgi:hypothetical protein